MRIPVRFSYKKYAHSKKATALSMLLGFLTSWIMYIVYICIWIPSVDSLLTGLGLSSDTSVALAFVSVVGMFFLVKAVRKTAEEDIDNIALEDFKKLQQANSNQNAEFAKVGDMFRSPSGTERNSK